MNVLKLHTVTKTLWNSSGKVSVKPVRVISNVIPTRLLMSNIDEGYRDHPRQTHKCITEYN